MGNNPIHILNNSHEIAIDQTRIKNHKKTTQGTIKHVISEEGWIGFNLKTHKLGIMLRLWLL